MNILNINNGEIVLEVRGFQEDCRKNIIPQDNVEEALDDDKLKYSFSTFLEDGQEDISILFPYFLNNSISNVSIHTVVNEIDSVVFSSDIYSSISTINTTWNPANGIERQIIFEKIFSLNDIITE